MPSKTTLLCAGLFAATTINSPAADFIVTSTNNSGAGSFRQAIIDANASPGLDRIVFNISGTGLQIIRLTAALPDIIGPLEIDGYTQPGSSPNTLAQADNAVLRVQLDGINGTIAGLTLSGGNSVVRGLVLSRFPAGIHIRSSSNIVVGNFIGTDASGTLTASNANGIYVQGGTCCNIIGGAARADRNVIAANYLHAVQLSEADSSPVRDSSIVGNFICIDASGQRPLVGASTSSAITARSSSNLVVGGLEPGAGNVIAATAFALNIYGSATNTRVLGNYIGVAADGKTRTYQGTFPAIGTTASGDWLFPGKVLIRSNTVAHQASAVILRHTPLFMLPGAPFGAAMGFTISQNSFFSNRLAGISFDELGKTNDLGDLDIGPNGSQNFPELLEAKLQTNTVISGIINSQPGRTYTLEFFGSSAINSNAAPDGEVYLGNAVMAQPGPGGAHFEVEFPGVRATYPWITATATDPDGNTSMLSRPLKARSPTLPLFHYEPEGMAVLPGTNLTFYVDVTGAEPISYQWRWDGTDLPGATNAVLVLPDVQWENRGNYTVTASNAFGTVESKRIELAVKPDPTILVPPSEAIVLPGTNVTFSVQAAGMLPIFYQWRHNGVELPGANTPTLVLTNVDWPLRGDYTVVLSNAFGVTESAPAGLVIKIKPIITQQPIGQGVAAGGAATLSVAVSNSATLPLTYLWRSNSLLVATDVSMKPLSFYTATNVLVSAIYSVQISNLVGPGVLSSRVTLSPLLDSDHDGLPDSFEDANELDRENPDDALLDDDTDGMSNAEEYAAGTDPQDPANRLRVQRIVPEGVSTWLEFTAQSNKTYGIEYLDALGEPLWLVLTNLPARSENTLERVVDTPASASRFYRLVTPHRP